MLYIYDIDRLNFMQESMKEYKFYSIAHILHVCDDINDLPEIFDNTHAVIDITNLITENDLNIIFVNRYLIALYEISDTIHFSLQTEALEVFKKKITHLVNNNEIDYSYQVELKQDKNEEQIDEVEEKIRVFTNLPIYTYDNSEHINTLIEKEVIISLSYLLEDNMGISYKYDHINIKNILLTNEIEYVDITSVVKLLKVRSDLIFTFEKILQYIISLQAISFIVDYTLRSNIQQLFPFVFTEIKPLNKEVVNLVTEEASRISIGELNHISEKINSRLKGHYVFKKDFRHNLLKFFFLKEIKERKILSILICGESGIGKTEFAKITSEIMYGSEQLIKINFGNYSTEGVLNSLIGSPLGYIGSDEGGELPNKIGTSKSKIILIDEFEKATPSVFNFFYELLEDGKFTDRHGNEHDLEGYIIIFTSNMIEKHYLERVPDALKSRFDMVYNFEDLERQEKMKYIEITAVKLIKTLNEEFDVNIEKDIIDTELITLVNYKNLRDIKRMIEDIIFVEFFKHYQE